MQRDLDFSLEGRNALSDRKSGSREHVSFRAVAQHVRAAIRLKKGSMSPSKKQLPVVDQPVMDIGPHHAQGQDETQELHLGEADVAITETYVPSPTSQEATIEQHVKSENFKIDEKENKSEEALVEKHQEPLQQGEQQRPTSSSIMDSSRPVTVSNKSLSVGASMEQALPATRPADRPISGGGDADLSGFPVMRLDHVALVESKVLERALLEIPPLQEDMFAEAAKKKEPVPKLAYYLQKQMDTMNAELMKRAAEQRIFAFCRVLKKYFRTTHRFYRGK